MVHDYRQLLAGIEKRHDECRLELAVELRRGYRADPGRIRAHLSALLWTLGDVVHAELLGEASYQPPLGLFRRLVDLSIERVPGDAFLQYLWLLLKASDALDLRSHPGLYWRLFSSYQETPVHQLDQRERTTSGLPLSHAYAKTLISHFEGALPDDMCTSYLVFAGAYADELRDPAPRDAVRLACLANLVDDQETPEERADQWRHIAVYAVAVMGEWARSGTYDAYDQSLSVPFHYLAGSSGGSLDGMLEALEAYRRARLWYWLTVSEAHDPDLVDQLRSIRVVQLYHEFFHGPGTWVAVEDFVDPSELFDDAYARQTVDRIERELTRARRNPAMGSLDRFQAALPGGPLVEP